MSTEDEKLLKEAKKLPWEDRLLHRDWKVRNDANIDLAALFESITDPKDPRIRELGHFFKKTVADSNEQVQDKALDALIAYLKAADADAARYAKDVCDAVVAKCLTGQMKTVEKAQMVFMLWVELEAVDVFLDAMEKAIKHEVAKAVVPAIDVMFQALSEFGSKIVPPKRILKMLPELFDHQDQNVRASCKGLMLELCRWIGRDPVKSVLFEKMRDEMKKELEAELDNVSGGAAAKPSRKIRSEQDKEPEQKAEEATAEIPHEIDELVDPVDILTPLEKSGFWNGVKPTKPKEARPKLTNLASTKRDFSEICPTLNKEMVCKICLLDNRSYEISCNDATTVSDAVQEVARLVKLSTHSGFGVFKDENVCFCGNANYIPLHENKKLIDVLAELNVKDKLIFKIKVFRDEAITDPVFLYMSFVQLKHDYICGNYSCISQGTLNNYHLY